MSAFTIRDFMIMSPVLFKSMSQDLSLYEKKIVLKKFQQQEKFLRSFES